MHEISSFLQSGFIIVTLITLYIFYLASGKSKLVLLVITGWLLLQALIAGTGFYTNTTAAPPRFMLAVLPAFVLIVLLFSTNAGRRFVSTLNMRHLTLLHTIRIPVELVLFALYLYKVVPLNMTFEGQNFDIVSGISAPVIYYLIFVKKTGSYRLLLAWNIICLLLLLNIVITAVLSAPFPFQQLAFEQPNIAILYFPFVWLPCCVVPLVLLAHLAGIYQLLRTKSVAAVQTERA